MEKFITTQEPVYLVISDSDRATFERLLFGCVKLMESINKTAVVSKEAREAVERFKIAVRKAKRTEMYKRHFNKKRT